MEWDLNGTFSLLVEVKNFDCVDRKSDAEDVIGDPMTFQQVPNADQDAEEEGDDVDQIEFHVDVQKIGVRRCFGVRRFVFCYSDVKFAFPKFVQGWQRDSTEQRLNRSVQSDDTDQEEVDVQNESDVFFRDEQNDQIDSKEKTTGNERKHRR